MAIKFRTAITPPSGNGTKNGRVYVALDKGGYSLPGDSTYHVHHDGKVFVTSTTRGIHLGNFKAVKTAIVAIKRDANSRLKLSNPSRVRNPNNYEVIVGNIGIVYSGSSKPDALHKYYTYMAQSKQLSGRASGEDVTLMANGHPIKEYDGANAKSNPSRGRSLGTESSYPRVGRRVKRKTESRVSTALNKFMKCKAVRFNRNGSVSIKK